jgi:uncharacterized protein YkwD
MMRVLGCLGVILLLAGAPALAGGTRTGSKETKLTISEDEQAIIDLVNKERKKQKLPPLKANALLFRAARGHSANMAAQQKMNHVLDRKDLRYRLKKVGYPVGYGGENIAWASKQVATAETVMKNWMNSSGHRANILGKSYTEIGIGIAEGDDGKVYYTQVFGKPAGRR